MQNIYSEYQRLLIVIHHAQHIRCLCSCHLTGDRFIEDKDNHFTAEYNFDNIDTEKLSVLVRIANASVQLPWGGEFIKSIELGLSHEFLFW